jgi:hypothetical protein
MRPQNQSFPRKSQFIRMASKNAAKQIHAALPIAGFSKWTKTKYSGKTNKPIATPVKSVRLLFAGFSVMGVFH